MQKFRVHIDACMYMNVQYINKDSTIQLKPGQTPPDILEKYCTS
jgi:hypothetical protein